MKGMVCSKVRDAVGTFCKTRTGVTYKGKFKKGETV
jgi:hypothetical protein